MPKRKRKSTAGRDRNGRIKKGHHLTRSGRVVKSSKKKTRRRRR